MMTQFIKLMKNLDKSGVRITLSRIQNGKDAIQALEQIITNNEKLPDLILLDIEMPVLDGWGFMIRHY
jgi:CheY-like chemotaxis protein